MTKIVLKERNEPTQPGTMNEEAAGAEQREKLKWAAIQERVRKHRAANKSPPTVPRPPPKSSQERVHQCRLKKLHQPQALSAIHIKDAVASDSILARNSTSAERTRRYRQRLRDQTQYVKETPLTKSERNSRCYAKAQQIKLQGQIAEASSVQVRDYGE